VFVFGSCGGLWGVVVGGCVGVGGGGGEGVWLGEGECGNHTCYTSDSQIVSLHAEQWHD
jgi:hypothetical protein